MQIYQNHLGFAPDAPKGAVIALEPTELLGDLRPSTFAIVPAAGSGQPPAPGTDPRTNALPAPYQGGINPAQPVAGWQGGRLFASLGFDDFQTPGEWRLAILNATGAVLQWGEPFAIRAGILTETLADTIWYFRSQRCSGLFDRADRAAKVTGSEQRVDVHGGWYDASGDLSKYLTHLSYAHFWNPQQTPLVVWSLLRSARLVGNKGVTPPTPVAGVDFDAEKVGATVGATMDPPLRNMALRLLEEGAHGADFLMRMQCSSGPSAGAFYQTLFDKWSKSLDQRDLCQYRTQSGEKLAEWQASWRAGGGMAIAALALAGGTFAPVGNDAPLPCTDKLPPTLRKDALHPLGEYTAQQWLQAAIVGWDHLEQNGQRYLSDGRENIIDYSTALLAAAELWAATGQERFRTAARRRSLQLLGLQESAGHWRTREDLARPFSHASDAGLPLAALLRWSELEADAVQRADILQAVKRNLEAGIALNREVPNPFGYPRQRTQPLEGPIGTAFFIPHKNETGYWWQGENARLGSLAAVSGWAAKALANEAAAAEKPTSAKQGGVQELARYGQNCLDWILGSNPFDACMFFGRGRNNPNYLPAWPSCAGGICNGITSGFLDEQEIALRPQEPAEATEGHQNWRWGEQWIPHAAWYLLAVASRE
jgi:hypothetical protein